MRRLPRYTLLLMAALLCGGVLCGALLYGAYSVARQEALDNLNAQQTILARQASQGIQDYFGNLRNLAWSVAQNSHVVDLDKEGEKYLQTVLRENAREVLGITRMDAKGVIQFSTPDNSVAGRDITSQEHVARILATHNPVVSDVITSTQGYRTIILHVPVFKGEEFKGSLGVLLNFDAIARRYLAGVRVGETGYAFVYSQKGVLLYSPVPGISGKRYEEVTRDFPELRAVVERMLAGESGTATFTFDRVRDQAPQEVRKHAVFMPINLGDTFWSICVTTPESELLSSLERFGLYLLPLGSMVLLFTALGVALGLRHFVLEKEILRRRETETALRESEERYRSVIENISDVFYRTDALGHLIMLSPSGLALGGYDSADEILGKPIASFWCNPADRERLMAELEKHGSVRDFEVELTNQKGKVILVATSSNFYRDKDGNILGVEGIFRDISQRKRDEAALEESARRFHTLFDNMVEGVALCTLVRDASGKPVNFRIEEVNHSYEGIFNVKAADVAGRLVTEIFGLPRAPDLQELADVVETGRPFNIETMVQPLGKHLAFSAVPWVDGGFASIVVDITERKQMESQLRYRALHDPLTGLANRTLCLDRIALAGERAQRRPGLLYAVVFMDLDRFKVINDSLGHEAGDMLLREVSSRLLACTRRMDTVCRYGGDEFALVLEELSAREVLRTLRRIRESLKNPVGIGGHSIQVEASFGVAYPPATAIGPEDILRNANIALHRAKHAGRNRVVVYKQSMHVAAIEIMSLENDIRRGLVNGEFHMLYQPTFDLKERRLRGFEALLRWRHPLRGAVGPVEFIPVAEESGSIFELGSFALDRACQEMAEFLRTHPEIGPLTLSVNLSPRQFARQGLAEQIDRALAFSGLPPQALMLEITESSIMKHPEASAHILSRIKERGVGIAIDDFGTGYSSMSALQHLPLDCLKIDRSFISRITESSEDREIVRAIITLAASLHLGTVAEGIETEAQRQLLEDLGCQLGQGFLCAAAVTLEEAPRAVNPEVCRAPVRA
jgi:diguanylate cyclase (GGDEF)-like protein/PAS domain S-box-containing protein